MRDYTLEEQGLLLMNRLPDLKPTSPAWAPNGIFLGALREHHRCYDYTGRELRIVHQSSGSTTVDRQKDSGIGNEIVALSNETVVYTTPKRSKSL